MMMNSTLTPSMEAVAVPGRISGSAIIADLLKRIGERLSGDCNLRASDAYGGYSFQAAITIQLNDVYPVEVATVVEAGRIHPHRPALRIDLGTEVTAAEPAVNLERPVDPAGFMEPEPVSK